MLGNFFPITIIFFYVYDFTDIDECKGNHSCHVNATCKNILGSHVRQCQAGYTGNGRNCSGEINLFAIILRIVLHHDTFNYSAAPFSRVARQLDNLSMRNSAILSSLNIEESNTQMRVDMEFLFECSTRYLMSESSKRIRYRAREYRLNYNLLVSSWTWEEKVHNCKQTYIILFII